jgi:UDP-N-acetylmuramate: L-alanyl-gamma-D-glutamyl-meso-diaminopimelate ligase
MAWVLEVADMEPSFMIGGIANNFQANFKLANGPHFVIEGDEYDTAFFDKGPKFIHYNPWVAVITSIEFDHADIYRDLDHIVHNFRRLINLIPSDGLLVANSDDPVVRAESLKAKCRVDRYALTAKGGWNAVDIETRNGFTHLRVLKDAREYLKLATPVYGRHNLSNLLSGVAAAFHLGVPKAALARAAKTFKGVKRRQEVVGEKQNVLVIDDFAHHPTAVQETIGAVKARFKTRRLVAVFEPRSNSSRRNIFQEKYALSFDQADVIMIPEPVMMEKIPAHERFSSERLVSDLQKRGLKAFFASDADDLLAALLAEARSGDVFLFMSNGAFDSLPRRFLEALDQT